ncbi:hypothetical protein [Brevundimonas lenta]|uniref:Uncharacterized protein n=1 Tax=Brevundimonas lenta TaxID=424796 RepID=A0A7W6JDW3_9CAUL|nr:hypothetical protein [Brevundimonas lenta]MBB4082332.1 hypothetical protein [Brevundimonas lenta]
MVVKFKKAAVLAAVMAMVGASAHAHSGSNRASTTFRIFGIVPVLCRVQLSNSMSAPDEEGVAQLGVASEFCNAPRGYRVVVSHPSDLEGAALIADGQRIPLSAGGETVLTDSSHPDLRQLSVALDLGEQPERFSSLGLRIEAKS